MNDRQKRFCEEYAANPDATAAALAAGYSARSAASIGSENLKKLELRQYIQQLQQAAADIRIATVSEAKAVWSDLLRDPTQKAADRIRAGELLVRSAGGFVSIRAGEDGLAVSADSGGAVIIMPTSDGTRGDPIAEKYLTEEEKRDGWSVIR